VKLFKRLLKLFLWRQVCDCWVGVNNMVAFIGRLVINVPKGFKKNFVLFAQLSFQNTFFAFCVFYFALMSTVTAINNVYCRLFIFIFQSLPLLENW